MKIQVLGMGCPKCRKTAEVMQEAATRLGLREGADFVLEKIEKIGDIMSFGITVTPGVAIDGKVLSSGKVPSMGEATNYITTKLSEGA
jgi:small redox-active disulfide protein 2